LRSTLEQLEPGGQWLIPWVNEALTSAEVAALRRSVQRGTPYGPPVWVEKTARRLGLEATLRPRGRPSKKTVQKR
jgi:putative transposase